MFFLLKPMDDNGILGVANLDPRGMVSRIYKGVYLTLLYTKYKSFWPYVFGEENFVHVLPIVS